jgi:hypothetical protein
VTLARLGERVWDIGASDRSEHAVLQGVTLMQTISMKTPARHDGTLRRTARVVGKWLSRAVNAIGQPYANSEADRWTDWPRFPPF